MAAGRGGAPTLRPCLRPRPATAAAADRRCSCFSGTLPGRTELGSCRPLAAHLASMTLDAASIWARSRAVGPQRKCSSSVLKTTDDPAQAKRRLARERAALSLQIAPGVRFRLLDPLSLQQTVVKEVCCGDVPCMASLGVMGADATVVVSRADQCRWRSANLDERLPNQTGNLLTSTDKRLTRKLVYGSRQGRKNPKSTLMIHKTHLNVRHWCGHYPHAAITA